MAEALSKGSPHRQLEEEMDSITQPEASAPGTAQEAGPLVELGRGSVQTWECDAMGHLNVQYYMTRAQDAMAELLFRCGVSPSPGQEITGVPRTLSPRAGT